MQTTFANIKSDWNSILKDELQKAYFQNLTSFLKEKRKIYSVFPEEKNVFEAFNLTPLNKTKVVIIGQDPYHGKGQAHGLSFSVPNGFKIPPSLKNIFKELHADLGLQIPTNGNLTKWAEQGVLLLNVTLTVKEKEAGSHQKQGWETFTNHIINTISDEKEGVVFLLWGKFAQNKTDLIDSKKHFILKAPHPSPFSAYSGFFGCKHFSKTNEILIKNNQKPIDWKLCSNTLTLF